MSIRGFKQGEDEGREYWRETTGIGGISGMSQKPNGNFKDYINVDNQVACTGLTQAFCIYGTDVQLGLLMGLLKVETGDVSDSLPDFGTLILVLDFLVQPST